MASEKVSNSVAQPVTLTLHELREREVILDRDLAALYGIPTKRLNIYVARHAERFPPDFAFQVTAEEWKEIKARLRAPNGHGGQRYRPHVFTEQGVMMVASILRGRRAAAISIEILRAFARGRRDGIETTLESNSDVFRELDRVASTPPQLVDVEAGVITYFVQAGSDGLIKIGITTDFEKRLRALQTSSPLQLRVLGVVAKDIEDYCHVALADWRVHGEWFQPVQEVLSFIEEQLPKERSVN